MDSIVRIGRSALPWAVGIAAFLLVSAIGQWTIDIHQDLATTRAISDVMALKVLELEGASFDWDTQLRNLIEEEGALHTSCDIEKLERGWNLDCSLLSEKSLYVVELPFRLDDYYRAIYALMLLEIAEGVNPELTLDQLWSQVTQHGN